MSDYADVNLSLTDHLAAALKPIDRIDVAFALADAFGSRVKSGERSVLANVLLSGDAIDKVLLEIRDLLDGATAVEQEVA